MRTETRVILQNVGIINPESIDSYIEKGGYKALEKAKNMEQIDLIHEIENVGKLRGRGGAGFNTGLKWSGAYNTPSEEKYVVCNADEGEPGTFKDRTIIEGDPHRVLEGILIGCYAIGATEAFIYCRGEYENAIRLLRLAIDQAEKKKITGNVKVKVLSGAGSYVCGEETTLLTSMEGKRAEPRLKPPFPTVAGYLGKPTVVNNVETFASIPALIENGAEWFQSLGVESYPGTKVFSISGDVKKPGCYETSTDVTLRELIFDLAGGMKEGSKLKLIQVGGSSSSFLTEKDLDISMDFDALRKRGAALGSGAILVIDDSHDLMEMLSKIAHFFQHESCGKCTPCREGTMRAAEILDNFAAKKGTKKELELLNQLSRVMAMSCFCPLGQSALTGFNSIYKLFPEEFSSRMEVESHE